MCLFFVRDYRSMIDFIIHEQAILHSNVIINNAVTIINNNARECSKFTNEED